MNYYNENDPKTASWLEQLIKDGLVSNGIVDKRSISDVQPTDLQGFSQCHFFAGIGGWSYALRLAGWPDNEPVWTGSCPCQPFSFASTNKAKGTSDSRDLWPNFSKLIGQCDPSTVFGEQVRSAVSWGWWDRAKMDLEVQNYAAAAAILRSDSIGAEHERKRLYWVANASSKRRERCQSVQLFSSTAQTSYPINSDPLVRARKAMAGDFKDLLPFDGLSVSMAGVAIKGFGNAIVPKLAAKFIQAACEAIA